MYVVNQYIKLLTNNNYHQLFGTESVFVYYFLLLTINLHHLHHLRVHLQLISPTAKDYT